MRWAWLIAALLACLGLAPPACADELRPGYLDLTQRTNEDWRVVWKAPIAGGMAGGVTPVFPDACTSVQEAQALEGDALRTVWSLTCPKGLEGERVGLTGLGSTVSDALVRVAPLDRPSRSVRLTIDEPDVDILARPDRLEVAKTYLVLGVQHILFGLDHLLFVLSLVVLLRGGWIIAKTVTAFTAAHTLTLIGATLGWFSLPQAPVEAVIALSIVFLAVEIAKAQPGAPRLSERFPWVVAFMFGLLHGFGFAGALAEIGMPENETPVALLTFNIGVEIGQLAIVAAALVPIHLVQRFAQGWLRPVKLVAAYAIGCTASAWLIQRTFS